MSMKRLTDERITALIDMAPLSKTIVDIKSALVELQERRKADAEPVISIIIKDGWPEENTAAPIHGAPKLTDGTHELYAVPQPAPIAPDLSGIDMTNIFEVEELEMMSHGNNPRSNAYRELLAFRKAMGSQEFPDLKSEKDNSPVIPDGWVIVPKTATPDISLAINKVGQHCTCGNCSQRLWDMLLTAAPKPENAND
ncbi:hypothetical protein LEC33_22830 [Salmonella enterica]|nr:hypothetical protein [Salmonella enterica]MDJ7049160.1 hypothetical protein [Salmonella enterica]MDJ7338341.1 hypothetical protein [Salmonella enterica]